MIHSLLYGVLTRSVLFIINLIAVNSLVPDEYGFFSYILGFITSIATASAFGATVSVNTVVSSNLKTNKEYANRFVLSSIILSLSIAIPGVMILLPLLDLEHYKVTSESTNLLIIAIIVISMVLNSIAEGGLNGSQKYKYLSINSIAVFVIGIPLSLYLINEQALSGALISILLVRLLIVALNYISLYKAGVLRFKVGNLFTKQIRMNLFSLSLPSLLGGLMVAPVITIAMKMVSSETNGLSEIGYFFWVYQIYLIAIFIPGTLGGYYLSKFSQKNTKLDYFAKIIAANLLLSIIVTIILFLFKSKILLLSGNEITNQSSEMFNILIPAVVLYSVNAAFSNLWPSRGYAWLGFVLNFFWAVIFLSTTLLLKKSEGGVALSYSFVASYTFLLLLQSMLLLSSKLKLKSNSNSCTESV